MERAILKITLVAAIACLIVGSAYARAPLGSKLFNTASLLLGSSSILQLRVSGWFDRLAEIYGDDERYPFGPPNHITQQIIDDPDRPIRMWIRSKLFFESDTGAYLGLASIFVAIIAVWLP